MRHLFYLHNLPLPDKVAAQKKMKNKILARLYIYFPYGEISKKNLLKKPSEIDFSSGDILTSKKSRFQRILNRVRGKKKKEISPSYFLTPWTDRDAFLYLMIHLYLNALLNPALH